jgi:hypothetical protein
MDGPQKLTFTNAGNRAALLNRLGVTFSREEPNQSIKFVENCGWHPMSGSSAELFFDMQPLIIKPGEIVRIDSNVSTAQGAAVEGARSARAIADKTLIPNRGDRVRICLHFVIVTADEYHEDIFVSLFDSKVQLESHHTTFDLPGIGFAGPPKKPYVLLQRTQTIFDVVAHRAQPAR